MDGVVGVDGVVGLVGLVGLVWRKKLTGEIKVLTRTRTLVQLDQPCW